MTRGVRSSLAIALVTVFIIIAAMPAFGQTRRAPARSTRTVKPKAPPTPYEQGYATAYDAGYRGGQDDYNRGVPRSLQDSAAFQARDQGYDPKFADSEEYRQAYNLGLEFGYMDGYYGRPRSLVVPTNGAVIAKAAALAAVQRPRQTEPPPDVPRRDDRDRPPRDVQSPNNGPVDVPPGTQLNLRLTSSIDSKRNRPGDRFTAEVTTPGPYEGAKIDGHIDKLNQSGKVSGRTEMALAFDSITMPDGRSANLTASLEKITESETVKTVDEEGNVKTGSRTKDSQTRGAIGGAAGAIIGGIAGGVKGAVLGAIIGGAAGVGTVYIDGNKELVLDPGTEMVIRTERTRQR